MPAPSPHIRPRVIIVGGGFGGLEAAKALGSSGVAVTLIDKRNYHLFQPLLYQVATAGLSPADIAEPIRRVLRRYQSVDMRLGEVTGIDHARKHVLLAGQPHLAYDRLIVATGANLSYFGRNDWAALAPGLKSIEDARRIRSKLLLQFELAESETDPEMRRRLMTTVIVGGGPTGVELAGAIAELARFALVRDFRSIRPDTARIVLLEAGMRLLPGFSRATSAYTVEALERLGVEVVLGAAVESMSDDGVTAGGREISAGLTIWAAGIRASPAGEWLGAETDRQGRVVVKTDCSVPGFDGVYVIGDAAGMVGADGALLPGLAQVAQQQGRYIGKAIAAQLQSEQPIEPFRYRNRGSAAIIGRHEAVFEFSSGRRWTGRSAWLLWAIVHVWLLIGFERRLHVSLQWIWRYFTYQRGARLITDEPEARAKASQSP